MASLPRPLLPDQKNKPPKKDIDIPYNRWENRIRRAIKSFIKITLVLSVISFLIIFANSGDVELNLVLTGIETAFQLLLQVLTIMAGIVVQFGLLFWFLSRPSVEIIRPGDDTSVTFDDYWGQPQLVGLVKQWMSLLRDRKDFEKMGGKYISGLLLYGPPGTGKTMLAKAIAGESGMAFISALGTSFQGMFWGMDILKVLRFSKWSRDLAKKYGACVAYIDEIDAIGMSRGGVRGGGGMASGTGMGMGLGMFALSTLLSQMDGMNGPSRGDKLKTKVWKFFGKKYVVKRDWHVMWMGSTNRPDVLDPALTRSGRLDTKIAVEPPDRASRRLIIQGYLSKIKHDESVDVEAIVADTNNMTPADISGAITKDAVRLAFFAGRKLVTQKDIDKAFMEQQSGMEMPIEEMDEGQRRVLAYHEAGHAVAQYYMMPEQKIIRATIVRLSTGSFGHVAPVDTVEQHIKPVQRDAYDIIVFMAGRAAEKIYTGEIFYSVGGDFPAVAWLMNRMARAGYFGPKLAMEYNNMMAAGGGVNSNDKVLEGYWTKMEEATEALLRRHWKEISALAEELLVHHTLNGKEVVDIIEANQTADSLHEDQIIPKTLAALRAQSLAEQRSARTGSLLDQPNMPVESNESVVVINGTGNGTYNAGATASSTPAQPVQVKDVASTPAVDNSEPRMVNGGLGDFQPPIVGGTAAPPEPEQKN